jgi:myo-inositol 2-dehydrogenase/D-chiro-inositol 1-dehydrogenase
MTEHDLSGRAVRLAVIGLGFGRCHADVLAREEHVDLVAIADLDPDGQGIEGESFARRLGAAWYGDGCELIEREELDAVVVAVPPRHRGPLIAAAVDRGIGIFVEKPFATDTAQAAELAGLYRRSASPVMVDFCMRHLPAIARLRGLLDSALGPALVVNADLMLPRDDVPAWVWEPRDGNGIVNENACHLLDILCALLGEPKSVYAAGGSYLGHPLEDGAVIVVRFAGERVGVLSAGCLGAAPMATPVGLSVYTKRGHAKLEGRDHMVSTLRWASADSAEVKSENWPVVPRGEIAADALRHFVACLRSGRTPEPGIDAGLVALDIAMAARRSLDLGAEVQLDSR